MGLLAQGTTQATTTQGMTVDRGMLARRIIITEAPATTASPPTMAMTPAATSTVRPLMPCFILEMQWSLVASMTSAALRNPHLLACLNAICARTVL